MATRSPMETAGLRFAPEASAKTYLLPDKREINKNKKGRKKVNKIY